MISYQILSRICVWQINYWIFTMKLNNSITFYLISIYFYLSIFIDHSIDYVMKNVIDSMSNFSMDLHLNKIDTLFVSDQPYSWTLDIKWIQTYILSYMNFSLFHQLKFNPEGSDFMWITVGWSHTMQQKYIHKKGFCFASIFNPICGQQ